MLFVVQAGVYAETIWDPDIAATCGITASPQRRALITMAYIIGLGGPADPQALKLETRRHRWIRNVLRPEAARDQMRARIAVSLGACPRATPVSASAIYNCYGLAFAARRTAIVDEEDVAAILEDDQYRKLPWDPNAWLPGDVVIYRNEQDEIVHAGLVARKSVDLPRGDVAVYVLSAWGECGEYLHAIDEVPPLLGKPTEVVAQRFLYDS